MSSPEEASSPAGHDSSPAPAQGATQGNRFDQMFGNDSDNDEKLSVQNESGDESDVASRKRKRSNGTQRKQQQHSDDDGDDHDDAQNDDNEEKEEDDVLEELEDDLFGEELEAEKKQQLLDEDDLASSSREPSPGADQSFKRQADISIGRYHVLDPGEQGDIYLMKIPQYLPVIPELFNADTFTVPKTTPTQPSPYTLATTAVRFRQHPTQPDKFQSNSRIIRWSDGTLSLQIGSSPEMYDLPSKPLAPPPNSSTPYDPNQDSHTYLATPHEGANMLRFIGHATQSLSVMPAGDQVSDEAMARLHEQLSAAIAGKGGLKSMDVSKMEDPEKRQREAEKAEKERMRQQKRVENLRRRQNEIFNERSARARSSNAAGLSQADVDERKANRRRGGGSPAAGGRRGATREDDYERGDGFLADEDDEENDFIVESEDEDEDMEDDDEDEEDDRRGGSRNKHKSKSSSQGRDKKSSGGKSRPKPREAEMDEDDEDEEEEAEFTEDSADERKRKKKAAAAGGNSSKNRSQPAEEEDDDDEDEHEVRGGGGGRKRRRFVVEDDDEDDE